MGRRIEGQGNDQEKEQVQDEQVVDESVGTGGDEGVEAGAADEGGEPEYTPDYGYNILDERHEMPERVRPYIKSKEDEQYYRDLFERAHGLDHVKSERQRLREEKEQVSEKLNQYEPAVQYLQRLEQFKQNGDWTSYFEAQGIPQNVILQHAKQVLDVAQDPEKYQAYQENRNQFWQAQTYEQQVQQQQQMLHEQRNREVDMVIQLDPQVSDAARQFDERVGQPGAFKQQIFQYGQQVWNTQQRDVPAREAADYILKLMGYQPTNQMTPSQGNNMGYQQPPQQAPQQPGQSQPQGYRAPTGAQAKPPVLPSIDNGGGGGTSAVRRTRIKSIDDVKKARRERAQGIR